ncbi:MAG TPA: DUF3179 domain-containing protein [Candidatus Limnocylindria bacterium]|nr:DUF3179 domain-containing protein [Candidatus Limnocylindria bacterium]
MRAALTALAAVAATLAVACATVSGSPTPAPTTGWRATSCASAIGSPAGTSDEPGFARNTVWTTDFERHCVPLSEIVNGGPSRDGIPPLDTPQFYEQSRAGWLLPREPIIAVVEGGEARAYPLQILLWHEIANDTIAGRPIVVTFCPLCNTSLVFDRRVGGRELTFGTTGLLRLSDLVMWDRQTQSWWQQALGEGIVGAFTGVRLTKIDSQILSFEEFARAYPTGLVLSREAANAEAKAKTGDGRQYGTNPYVGYDKPDTGPLAGFWTSTPFDRRLPPKARIAVGTFVDPPIAFRTDHLRGAVATNDRATGHPFVLLYLGGVASPLDRSTTADGSDVGQVGFFDPVIDGRLLTFQGDEGRRTFLDDETGTEWTITGRAVNGPLIGRQLPRLRSDATFWFVWAAFRPDTEVRAR